MKLTHVFETVEMGDEIVAVPVDNSSDTLHGVLKLNKEGLEIFDMLKQEITEEEIVKRLSDKYENDQKALEDMVQSFIKTLKDNNLLSD